MIFINRGLRLAYEFMECQPVSDEPYDNRYSKDESNREENSNGTQPIRDEVCDHGDRGVRG